MAAVVVRAKRVRAYDFRRPDKISKEHLRSLEVMFNHFVRLATTFLVSQFRTGVQVSVRTVEPMTFGEFLDGVEPLNTLAIGKLEPLPGKFTLSLEQTLVLPMVEYLLGGGGFASVSPRGLTEIELGVIERVLRGLTLNLEEPFRQVAAVVPSLESVETNVLFVQFLAPGEIVVAVTLDVTLGPHEGKLSFCLPFMLLEPVLPRLTLYQRSASPDTAPAGSTRWDLLPVRVDLVCELGTADLPLRELSVLKPGDVVPLRRRITQPLPLLLGGRTKFRGRPVRVGTRVAYLVETVEGGEDP